MRRPGVTENPRRDRDGSLFTMLNRKTGDWRAVRHPLQIGLRGWRYGRRCLISPRGTVFETVHRPGMMLARKRRDFDLCP